MKKRVCLMFLAVLFVMPLFSLTARADIIYEPQDTFYNLHREDCEYHARNYTASGPNGDVTVYKSPESSAEVKTVPNGTEIHISYTYEDSRGILWGYCDFWEEDKSGWLPLEYMELIYDYISFEEDFGDEFLSEEGTLDDSYSGTDIIFWAYPGSDRYHTVQGGSNLPDYHYVYVDSEGIRWGYCGYYFGHRRAWINLDDPSGIPEEELALETVPETEAEATTEDAVEEIKPQRPWLITGLLTLAVGAVIAATGVTLKKMKKNP